MTVIVDRTLAFIPAPTMTVIPAHAGIHLPLQLRYLLDPITTCPSPAPPLNSGFRRSDGQEASRKAQIPSHSLVGLVIPAQAGIHLTLRLRCPPDLLPTGPPPTPPLDSGFRRSDGTDALPLLYIVWARYIVPIRCTWDETSDRLPLYLQTDGARTLVSANISCEIARSSLGNLLQIHQTSVRVTGCFALHRACSATMVNAEQIA